MELDAGYVILRELLIDEARLDGVLLLKSVPDSTETLIRQIAKASEEMLKELDSMADGNPELTMAFNGLPEIEKAVREAIASRTAMDPAHGDAFEYNAITQDKAMFYGCTGRGRRPGWRTPPPPGSRRCPTGCQRCGRGVDQAGRDLRVADGWGNGSIAPDGPADRTPPLPWL